MITPPAAQASREAAGRTWRVGTLVYGATALVTLFFWLLLGDFAWAMKERSSWQTLQLVLKKFGASDMISGLLIGSLPQIVAIIVVPIISYRSDRHRGPWGRRIPFLLIPIPLAVISMTCMAFGPTIGGYIHQVLGVHSPGFEKSAIITLGIFWTVFEFSTIMVNTLFNGLVNDVVPRELLGRFFGLFRAFSLIAGMIYNLWLVGKAEVHYFWIFLGIGLLYGGGLAAMCLNVREGEYPPPPPEGDGLPFFHATRVYLKECFTNSYYLYLFATCALAALAFVPINLFNLFFAKSVHMDLNTYGRYLTLTFLISLILSYLNGWLADRFHPLRMGLLTMVLYAGVTLWGGLFARDANTFGIALLAHGVLSGTWLTVTASLGQRLLPPGRFAQFASAQLIVTSLTTIIISPLMGRFLDNSGHIYRYTYLTGCVVSVTALLCGAVLHRKFMELGGPQNYVAPE